MLVLERKPHEALLLTRGDEKITITITRVRGGKARVGIEAREDWKIIRIDNIATDQATGGTEAVLKQGDANATT